MHWSTEGESIDKFLKFLFVYAKTIPSSHQANKSRCEVYHMFVILPRKMYMLSLVSIKSFLKNQMIFMAMSGHTLNFFVFQTKGVILLGITLVNNPSIYAPPYDEGHKI